ncbi:MAG: enoyl-CoA hydratase [Burkholderiales bacterium]|nr:enoyl-CoA hydratase [Burkholderiales bacterium]
MDYSQYKELKFRRPEPGILEIVMGEEGKLSVATARMHAEMAMVWLDVDRDPETRVAILRGAGKGFSAGGDLKMVAKAKYYLLLCETISGEEAERLGLVSLTCEEQELNEKALEVARKLAAGAQTALSWTKYSLNNWLRMAGPSFDASLALEVLGFTGPEAKEGVASHREKRKPVGSSSGVPKRPILLYKKRRYPLRRRQR